MNRDTPKHGAFTMPGNGNKSKGTSRAQKKNKRNQTNESPRSVAAVVTPESVNKARELLEFHRGSKQGVQEEKHGSPQLVADVVNLATPDGSGSNHSYSGIGNTGQVTAATIPASQRSQSPVSLRALRPYRPASFSLGSNDDGTSLTTSKLPRGVIGADVFDFDESPILKAKNMGTGSVASSLDLGERDEKRIQELERLLATKNLELQTLRNQKAGSADTDVNYLKKLGQKYFPSSTKILEAMSNKYYNLFDTLHYSFNDALVLESMYGLSIESSYNEIFYERFEFTLPAIDDLALKKATLLKFESEGEEILQIQSLTADTVDQYITGKISEIKFTKDEFGYEFARQTQLQPLFAKYDAMLEAIKTKLEDDIKFWTEENYQAKALGKISLQAETFIAKKQDFLKSLDSIQDVVVQNFEDYKKDVLANSKSGYTAKSINDQLEYYELHFRMQAISKHFATHLSVLRDEAQMEFYESATGMNYDGRDFKSFYKESNQQLRESRLLKRYNEFKLSIKTLEQYVNDIRFKLISLGDEVATAEQPELQKSLKKYSDKLLKKQAEFAEFKSQNPSLKQYEEVVYYGELIKSTADLYDYEREQVKSVNVTDALIKQAAQVHSGDESKQVDYLIDCRNSILELMYLYNHKLFEEQEKEVGSTNREFYGKVLKQAIVSFKKRDSDDILKEKKLALEKILGHESKDEIDSKTEDNIDQYIDTKVSREEFDPVYKQILRKQVLNGKVREAKKELSAEYKQQVKENLGDELRDARMFRFFELVQKNISTYLNHSEVSLTAAQVDRLEGSISDLVLLGEFEFNIEKVLGKALESEGILDTPIDESKVLRAIAAKNDKSIGRGYQEVVADFARLLRDHSTAAAITEIGQGDHGTEDGFFTDKLTKAKVSLYGQGL